MDPLVKRLLVIGVMGLIVTWGTFLALELTPEDEEPEPIVPEATTERHAGVSANKRREQDRLSRIAAVKRRGPVQKPPPVRPPVVKRPESPPAPQQTAAIKAPMLSGLPSEIPPSVNSANSTQARFRQMEKAYESEIRDSVWADEKEKRILDVFKKGDHAETLVDISCRKTLCRMEVRIDSPESLFRLFKLPGLAQEIGLNAATQPVGEGDEKRMVSFLVRQGPKE
jgi:hypothetical protein